MSDEHAKINIEQTPMIDYGKPEIVIEGERTPREDPWELLAEARFLVESANGLNWEDHKRQALELFDRAKRAYMGK